MRTSVLFRILNHSAEFIDHKFLLVFCQTCPERPELAEEIEKELPEFAYRLKVKAGLTGYAQIYGKYNTTAYDKLKLDLTYIRNYSFFLDLKLMIMTPKIMLMKESTEGVLDEDKRLEQQEAAAAKIEIKL